jgi:environmental stress-induced protein Ves
MATHAPTQEQFAALRAMFRHFNATLFRAELAEPMLNLSRGQQLTAAFFIPGQWRNGAGSTAHEISISPRYIADGTAYAKWRTCGSTSTASRPVAATTTASGACSCSPSDCNRSTRARASPA